MIARVKQFVTALFASIDDKDQRYITTFLSPEEERLFWQMSVPDQRHALNVAYTAERLAQSYQEAVQKLNVSLLRRGALLHDVGRQQGDLTIVDKIITVLFASVAAQWMRRLARYDRETRAGHVRHAFYVYFYHPRLGAEKLRAIGAHPSLIQLVESHHNPPQEDDPVELTLLRKADQLN